MQCKPNGSNQRDGKQSNSYLKGETPSSFSCFHSSSCLPLRLTKHRRMFFFSVFNKGRISKLSLKTNSPLFPLALLHWKSMFTFTLLLVLDLFLCKQLRSPFLLLMAPIILIGSLRLSVTLNSQKLLLSSVFHLFHSSCKARPLRGSNGFTPTSNSCPMKHLPEI